MQAYHLCDVRTICDEAGGCCLLLALEFMRNGMRPVKLSYKVLYDANAVTLLGQKAYESEPERLDRLAVLEEPLPQIEFGDVYDSIEEYSPFRELR